MIGSASAFATIGSMWWCFLPSLVSAQSPCRLTGASTAEERVRIIDAFAVKLAVVERKENIGATCRLVAVDEEWNRAIAKAETTLDLPGDWSAPLAALASSGTTGIPKFTLATHLQLYLHCAAYLGAVQSTRRQRFLLTLPLYFSAGRVSCLAHLIRGDTVILGPTFFTASEYVNIAIRHQVTVGFIVPSVVRQLLSIAELDKPLFPDIDMLASVGAPLFADEKREALRKLTPQFPRNVWRGRDRADGCAAARGHRRTSD